MFKCTTLSVSSQNVLAYHKISNGVIYTHIYIYIYIYIHIYTYTYIYIFFFFFVNPDLPTYFLQITFKPLNPELNPICYLLALLAQHFLHVSRIRVKSLTLRLLMSYIYVAPILDVSRSHTTTQHSR